MLALLSKSWRFTPGESTPLFSQCRPCLQDRVMRLPTKLYSSSAASQKLDQVTLHDFKRVLALRKKVERCDGADLLYDRERYAQKPRRAGIDGSIFASTLKGLKLGYESSEILSEICHREFRKEGIDSKAPEWIKKMHRENLDRGITFYGELLPVISRFEALLAADAAAQQPVLTREERGALGDTFRELLWLLRWRQRFVSAILIVFLLLVARVAGWLWSLGKRSMPGKERDFLELYQEYDDVE